MNNNTYSDVIKKVVLGSYQEFLIIDVIEDKIYKYVNNNGEFDCISESSYASYFEECKKFVFEDDIASYIDSLSLSKLEDNNSRIILNYRMLDNKIGGYLNYTNTIS